MDHEEEQRGEMEALESIYEGDLNVLSSDPPISFTLPVKSDAGSSGDIGDLEILLKFTLTPKYPDEAPLVQVEDQGDVDDEVLDEFMEFVSQQIDENLGMVMVFTILSASIEWLGNKNEEIKVQKEEEAKMKKDIEEEAERKRFEGTRVTVENFLAWKKRFDETRAEARRKSKEAEAASLKGKLTGRQLFIRDSTLNDSDVKFLQEAGETVKVDESLFEDLDDLELDESDDDEDPDWSPGDDQN